VYAVLDWRLNPGPPALYYQAIEEAVVNDQGNNSGLQ